MSCEDLVFHRQPIADCLRGVISQRLVRKVCEVSRQDIDADDHARRLLRITNPDPVQITTGIPTDQNFRTGYNGPDGGL